MVGVLRSSINNCCQLVRIGEKKAPDQVTVISVHLRWQCIIIMALDWAFVVGEDGKRSARPRGERRERKRREDREGRDG